MEIKPNLDEETLTKKEDLNETAKAKVKFTYEPPPYEPKVPYPGRVKKQLLEKHRKRFMDIVKEVEVSIPLLDAIEGNPMWKKLFKELLVKKDKIMKGIREEECKALEEASKPQALTKTLVKKEDPGKFVIPCSIGKVKLDDALCDSGAFVNVISSTLAKKMKLLDGMKPNSTPIVFGDASKKAPRGMIEDCPILVGNCIVPTDLLVLDMVDSKDQPLILGAPFLLTVGAVIDYEKKEVILKNVDEKVCYGIEPPKRFCGTIMNGNACIASKVSTMIEDTSLEMKDVVNVSNEVENVTSLDLVAPLEKVEKKPKQEVTIDKVAPVLKKKKKKTLVKAHGVQLESNPPSLTFKPLNVVDGKLECTVKSSSHSRPFAKVRVILDPVSMKNDMGIVSEKMSHVFGMNFKDKGPHQGGSSSST